MTINSTRIFNGTTNSTGFTVSDQFNNGSFIYLVFPDSTDEIAIDAYLQIQLSATTFRLIPVDKYEIDSESIVIIPEELKNSDINMRLVLSASSSDFVEIWLVENVNACTVENTNQASQIADILQAALNFYNVATLVFGLPAIPGLLQLIPTLLGMTNPPALSPGLGNPVNIPALPSQIPIPLLTGG